MVMGRLLEGMTPSCRLAGDTQVQACHSGVEVPPDFVSTQNAIQEETGDADRIQHALLRRSEMTPPNWFRLVRVRLGPALKASLPSRAIAFVPPLVTLIAYSLALPLTHSAQGAFVVAFVAGYGTQAWLRLPGLAKGEAVSMFGPESAVVVPLVVVALMVIFGQPIGCLRVFSVFAGMRAVILADELWRKRQRERYMQRLWPNTGDHRSDNLLASVFLVWSLVQIVLIEVVIAHGNLLFWLIFAAFANTLIVIVDRILVQLIVPPRDDADTA
jgi:hypothetical protein